MQTHEERIKELEAQGVRVMKPERAREIVLNMAKSFGLNMEEVIKISESEDEGRKIIPPEGFSISKYIIEMRRG